MTTTTQRNTKAATQDGPKNFRLITAPGWGYRGELPVIGTFTTRGELIAAAKRYGRGALAQESMSGEFGCDTFEYEDGMIKALAAGLVRNVEVAR